MSILYSTNWKFIFVLLWVVFSISACDNFELIERGANAEESNDRGSNNPPPPADTTVEIPTFDPAAGNVASGTKISVTTATSGAAIYYTLDGSEPDINSTEYTAPIALGEGNRTLKAIAVKEEFEDSAVAIADYVVGGIDQSLFQEKNGLVIMEAEASQEIVAGVTDTLQWNIIAQDDALGSALIQAPDTTEKSDTSAENTRADYKIYFTNPGTYYVFMRGSAAGGNRSAYFGLNGLATTAPAFFEFTAAAEAGWVWENNADTQGRATIQIPAQGEYTFNLWMKKPNLKIDQIILSMDSNYAPGDGPTDPPDPTDPTVTEQPAFDPPGGTFAPGAEVTITAATAGASIYYTIDGTDPDAFSLQYSGTPISLTLGKTEIRAIAIADGLDSSDVASESYIVTDVDAGREFQESGGMVVMEGENYSSLTPADTNPPFDGESWKRINADGATGGAAIQLPYMTLSVRREDHARAPRADYIINFSTSGTYYLWLRGQKNTNALGSLYVGIDGNLVDLDLPPVNSFFRFKNLKDWVSKWEWDDSSKTQVHAIQIATPGVYTLNLWMRYNGVVVDKIILANADLGFTPDDEGPAESTFTGGIPTVSSPAINPAGGAFVGAVDVSLSSSRGTKLYYTTDGSTPTVNSTLYTGPFTLYDAASVQAIAIRPGFNNSTVTKAEFTRN